MSGNLQSRRTLRTQTAIRNAFAGLLTEKELHKITVQELVDRADVGRATFYKHYLDIYDLYEKIESNTLTEIAALVLPTGEEPVADFFRDLLSYISNNRAVFKMIFSPNITAQLYVKLSDMM
jgi:AcrR family transcriptional regulator